MHTKGDDMQCRSCDAPSCDRRAGRRAFLQTAGYVSMAVALLGLSSEEANALTFSSTAGTSTGDGGERRYPIPATDGVSVDHQSQVIVARVGGHIYAFALSCPHQNNAVKWLPKDHRFQCTKHDSQYQPDGVHTSGRATRNLDRYAIRRDGDSVVVDLHRWIQSDKDPAAWAAATISA